MRYGFWLVTSLVLAACGGDDALLPDGPPVPRVDAPASECTFTGSAEVTGELAGVSIAPVARAYVQPGIGGGVTLILDEAPGECPQTAPPGEHLALHFCGFPEARMYPVRAPGTTCPGGDVGVQMRDPGTLLGNGTAGSVTITDVDGTCIQGSFEVTIENDRGDPPATFTGTFGARACS